MDFEIDCIKITQEDETVTGRHARSLNLEMKLSRMNFEIQRVCVFHTDVDNKMNQKQAISNVFNIDFILVYPNYS